MPAAARDLADPHPRAVASGATGTVVLLLTRDPAGARAELGRLLPGRPARILQREEIRGLGPLGLALRLRALRAAEIVILLDDLETHEAPGRILALLALPLARRRLIIDRLGRELRVTAPRFLFRDLPFLLAGTIATGLALMRTSLRLRALGRAPRHTPRPATLARIACLRSEAWSGIAAGGSVGHTAGVATGLGACGCEVRFIATRRPAALDEARSQVTLVPPRRLYSVRRELPAVAHSLVFERGGLASLRSRPAGLLYQRFDPASHAGVRLSRRFDLPLVLEYNGSEVWIADHWGRGLRHRRLFESIESVNLKHADLIVVVSAPLRDDLVSRGVERERIVVLPNGVDTRIYRPDIDGGPVRARHGLHGARVVGFIGTFEAWHGAPVLAGALARLLRDRADVRLLMVGDGPQRPLCEEILRRARVLDRAVFTGLVPQAEGPAHLAAMDVLAAPHVPNADGSRFFGSPTKLFEYMAMGRAIVASRLEQIGEVLEDGGTAVLVPPADEAALERAVTSLVDDEPRRSALGAAARRRAVERHTWEAHARALLQALRDRGLLAWS